MFYSYKSKISILAIAAFLLPLMMTSSWIQLKYEGDTVIFQLVTRILSSGGKLYSTVWDNKDPLFYGLLLPFEHLFGYEAIRFFEIGVVSSLSAVLALFAFHRSKKFVNSIILGFCCSISTISTMNDGAYYPGLTHTVGIAVVIVAVISANSNLYSVAFLLSFISLLIEFRCGAISFTYVSLVFILDVYRGFTSFSSIKLRRILWILVAVILYLSRYTNIWNYLKLFDYNWSHSSDVTLMLSELKIFRGANRLFAGDALRAWEEFGIGTFLVLGALIAFSAISVWHRNFVGIYKGILLVSLTSLIVGQTYIFDHHVQVLAIPISVLFFEIVTFQPKKIIWRGANLALAASLLLIVIVSVNLRSNDPTKRPMSEVKQASVINSTITSSETKFSVFGFPNSSLMLKKDLSGFTCKLLYQLPWDRAFWSDYLECIKSQPDYVLKYDLDTPDIASFAILEDFKRKVADILTSCFSEINQYENLTVYVRTSDDMNCRLLN